MLDRDATVALAKRMLALLRGRHHRAGGRRVPRADGRLHRRSTAGSSRWIGSSGECRCRSPSRASCANPTRTRRWTRSASRSSSLAGPTAERCAFVNACRHRGSIVVPDGCGEARRFTCPYHGWVYDRAGSLSGMYGSETFGEIDRAAAGPHAAGVRGAGRLRLRHLDTRRRRWTSTTGSVTTRPSWRRSSSTRGTSTTRRELPSPAWKVAFDGYLEGYHFSTLHKNTIFKDNMSNLMAVDAYGPHQRIMFAKHTLPVPPRPGRSGVAANRPHRTGAHHLPVPVAGRRVAGHRARLPALPRPDA